jgi:hypothetical protein
MVFNTIAYPPWLLPSLIQVGILLLFMVVSLRVLSPLRVNSLDPISLPSTLAVATTPHSISLPLLVLVPLQVLSPF